MDIADLILFGWVTPVLAGVLSEVPRLSGALAPSCRPSCVRRQGAPRSQAPGTCFARTRRRQKRPYRRGGCTGAGSRPEHRPQETVPAVHAEVRSSRVYALARLIEYSVQPSCNAAQPYGYEQLHPGR